VLDQDQGVESASDVAPCLRTAEIEVAGECAEGTAEQLADRGMVNMRRCERGIKRVPESCRPHRLERYPDLMS
jgi:hypothetical protein